MDCTVLNLESYGCVLCSEGRVDQWALLYSPAVRVYSTKFGLLDRQVRCQQSLNRRHLVTSRLINFCVLFAAVFQRGILQKFQGKVLRKLL